MSNDLFTLKRKLTTCCVFQCSSSSDSETSYHSFPRDVELRKKWQERLRIDDVDDSMKVCGAHFSSDDFFPTFGEFKSHKLKVKRLKRNAAPTLHLPDVSVSTAPSSPLEGNYSSTITGSSNKCKEVKSDPYAIETYCCATCGDISNTEAQFYEHLNAHVKIEHEEINDVGSVDPFGPSQSLDPLLNSQLIKQEEEESPYHPEDGGGGREIEDPLPDIGLHPGDADGGTIEDDEGSGEMNESHSDVECAEMVANATSRSTLCNFCHGQFEHISWHLASAHLKGPLIEDLAHKSASENCEPASGPPLLAKCEPIATNEELLKECLSGGPQEQPIITDSLILWDNEFTFKMKGAVHRKKTTCKRRRFIRFPPFTKKMLEEGDQNLITLYKSDRRYHCFYCPFNTNDCRLARAHFQLHAEGKSFGCHGCQKYYANEDELMEKHTTGTNLSVCRYIIPLDFRLRCDECWMYFGTQRELVFHLIYDDCPKKTKVACSVCGQKIVKYYMDKHLSTHNEVKA